jgi:hypothetical protein
MEQRLIEPNIYVLVSQQKAPPGRKSEIRDKFRAPIGKVHRMQGIKKVCGFR